MSEQQFVRTTASQLEEYLVAQADALFRHPGEEQVYRIQSALSDANTVILRCIQDGSYRCVLPDLFRTQWTKL